MTKIWKLFLQSEVKC